MRILLLKKKKFNCNMWCSVCCVEFIILNADSLNTTYYSNLT